MLVMASPELDTGVRCYLFCLFKPPFRLSNLGALGLEPPASPAGPGPRFLFADLKALPFCLGRCGSTIRGTGTGALPVLVRCRALLVRLEAVTNQRRMHRLQERIMKEP